MKGLERTSLALVLLWAYTFQDLQFVLGAKDECVQDLSKVEPGRTCRKPCTSNKECKGDNKKCKCDNHCGMSCFNKDAECNPPNMIENGMVTGDDYKHESVIEYSCNDGYILNGPRIRTCHADRQWGGPEPACVLGCPTPPWILGSFPLSSENGFPVGVEVEYECKFGYTISGVGKLFCQNDYKWSEPLFQCVKVSCGHPGNPLNGYIEGNDFTFASRIFYHCEKGYEIDDAIRNSRYCSSTGTWSGEPRTCAKIRCPPPVIPENGFANVNDHQYEFRTLVTYSCKFGYQLNGNSRGECNEDGNWGLVPTCTVEVDCNFDGFENPLCGYTNEGTGKWERQFLQDNTLSGHPTYIIRASSTPAVLRSPLIVSYEPHCFKFNYIINNEDLERNALLITNKLRKEDMGTIHPREPMYTWLDQQVTVMPMDIFGGIQLDITVKGRNTKIDMDDFSLAFGACESNCGEDTCQNGGTCIDRAKSYTCICTRFFAGKHCETEIICPAVKTPQHGAYKISPDPQRLRVDTRVTFFCDDGYKRTDGPTVITCDETGAWSSSKTIVCTEILCERLGVPGKGRMIVEPDPYRMRIGTVARFHCYPGTYLSGPWALVCREDGAWSSSKRPICEEQQPAKGECPKEYRRLAGGIMCYKEYEEPKTYEEATSTCASNGAILAIIQSMEARSALTRLTSSGKSYHLGFNDIGRLRLEWVNGDYFVEILSETFSGDFTRKEIMTDESKCGSFLERIKKQTEISKASCAARKSYICQKFTSDVVPIQVHSKNEDLRENATGVYRPVHGLIYNGAAVYRLDNSRKYIYLFKTKHDEVTGWGIGYFSITKTLPVPDQVFVQVNSAETLPQSIAGNWTFGSYFTRMEGQPVELNISTYDQWRPWSAWGDCPVSCGRGLALRKRRCGELNGKAGFGDCPGYHVDARECNTKQCIPTRWSSWGAWSACTKPCDRGRRSRTRSCLKHPESLEQCPGEKQNVRLCNKRKCIKALPMWSLSKPKEYIIMTNSTSRADAVDICLSKSGRLASIDDETVLNITMAEAERMHCEGEAAYEAWGLWIDLMKDQNNSWSWGSGSNAFSYEIDMIEMSNVTDDCALLEHNCRDLSFKWIVGACGSHRGDGFVCERDSHPCNRNPCKNGGECKPLDGEDYQCKCPDKYKGPKCTIPITCSTRSFARKYIVLNAKTMLRIEGTSVEMEESIHLKCLESNSIAKSGQIFTCIGSEKWDNTPKVECESTCLLPKLHPDITARDSGTEATVVKAGDTVFLYDWVIFSCPDKMEIEGNQTAECVKGGWDVDFPTGCVDAYPCLFAADRTRNGIIKILPEQEGEFYKTGTVITLNCKDSHVVSGEQSITCGSDGKWSSDLGTCEVPSDLGCEVVPSRYEIGTVTDVNFEPVSDEAVMDVGTILNIWCPTDSKISFVATICKSSEVWEPTIAKALDACNG